MSTAKRSRRRPTEAQSASPPPPASKRLKTAKTSHVPAPNGLGFLLDEDARAGKKVQGRLTNGVPSAKTTRVDESRAVVVAGAGDQETDGKPPVEIVEISSGEEASEDDASDADGDDNASGNGAPSVKPLSNGHIGGVHDVKSGVETDGAVARRDEADAEESAQPEELSFADMLQARHPETIDVHASLQDPRAEASALIPGSGSHNLPVPSMTSLTTVLTQALKTNDRDLLESCFQITDLPSIRSTIQRLQSQHVAHLIQRLAERIHKRPGRTGNLMVWVQWSLVAHGGYLANQPEVTKMLKALSQVVRERANGLKPLLHLKGKLDMLSAQLELRKTLQATSRAANAEDEDDEEAVLYIEGGDNDDWSDDETTVDRRTNRQTLEMPRQKKGKAPGALPESDVSDSEDGEEKDDDMPNGVDHGSEKESSEGEDDAGDDEGLIDMEAEETSDDEAEADSDEELDSEVAESDDESDGSEDDGSDEIVVSRAPASSLNRKR